MAKSNRDSVERTVRVWACIDPTEEEIMRDGALRVLFSALDKTGGFPRKAGVTKGVMAGGAIRSFISKREIAAEWFAH